MNKILLTGRVVADPDKRATPSGKSVASYRLAVDRGYKTDGQTETDFISCTAWGNTADFAGKYLHKGIKILVEGSLRTSSYEKDGVRHNKVEVLVERHEFLEPRQTNRGSQQEEAPTSIEDFPDITSDDIPF